MNCYALLVLLSLFSLGLASSCKNPQVTSTSYTTQDATVVVNIAFVTEFTLTCSNGASGIPLHAEMNGLLLPVVHTFDNRYQVSWAEDVTKASSGDHIVNLYDEEGFALLRKSLRNPELSLEAKPITTVTVNHPGTYKGPWVNSEFMAAALAILVWWMAFSAKSKLLS